MLNDGHKVVAYPGPSPATGRSQARYVSVILENVRLWLVCLRKKAVGLNLDFFPRVLTRAFSQDAQNFAFSKEQKNSL